MRRFLSAVLLSALLLTLHGSLLKNSETKTAVHPKAGQRQRATLTAKPSEQVLTVQAAAPVAPPVQETPESQTVTGCAAYRSLLAQYEWNVEVAINVCNAESNGNASNDNPEDYHLTCMGSRGLFQIGCDSTDNYAGMFDPTTNIAQAYALYSRRGWQPWSSTTCAVKVRCY